MISAGRVELSPQELEELAWGFLGSEFTTRVHVDWPIERCLDAYLLHHGLIEVANDGSAYSALLDRVMANIPAAIRIGTLTPPRLRQST